jgi:O-antigen ligase
MLTKYIHTSARTLINNSNIFEWHCIGIMGGMVFWPLLSSLLIISLTLYWLLFIPKYKSTSQKYNLLIFLFAALYLLVVSGYCISNNKDVALFKIQQKSPLLLFPLIFGFSRFPDGPMTRKIFFYFILFTGLGCLYCLGNGLIHLIRTGSFVQLYGYDLIVLKDMSPFIMGLFCYTALIIIFTSANSHAFKNKYERWLTYGLALLFMLFLLLLGNRSVILSGAISVAILLFFRVAQPLKIALYFLAILIVLGLAVKMNPSLQRQWNDLTDNSESNHIPLDEDKSLGRSWGGKAIRVAIWECAIDAIREHMWLGVGSGDAQDTLQRAYEKRKFYFASRYNAYNAHNQYLQDSLTYGVAGIMLLLGCFITPFLTLKFNNENLPYFLFLVSIIIICFTESLFELSKGVILYAFFNSIFAFNNKQSA